MRNLNKTVLASIAILLLQYLLNLTATQAQSAVVVYKDMRSGHGDYWYVYAAPKDEALSLAKNKLIEAGYNEDKIEKYAETDRKGYGVIVRSDYITQEGVTVVVYGASVGAKSYQDAEKQAVQNMKKYNPQWTDNRTYSVVERFFDQ